MSISKLVTFTARPIPHQKSQSAKPSNHTTNGCNRPLSVRMSWLKDVRKRVRSNSLLSPCQVVRKHPTPRNPQRPNHNTPYLRKMSMVRTPASEYWNVRDVRLGDKISVAKKLEPTSHSPVDLLLCRPASTDIHATQQQILTEASRVDAATRSPPDVAACLPKSFPAALPAHSRPPSMPSLLPKAAGAASAPKRSQAALSAKC